MCVCVRDSFDFGVICRVGLLMYAYAYVCVCVDFKFLDYALCM